MMTTMCYSVWPAYSPPIHRFGVVPFRWHIRRRSTNLVLFRLASAFPAEPPLIWCCSIWLAHSLPSRHRFGFVSLDRRIPHRFWSLRLPAYSPPTHRFGVAPFSWRIPSPHHYCPFFRRRIPSPFHHRSFWPAHSLAGPPLPT